MRLRQTCDNLLSALGALWPTPCDGAAMVCSSRVDFDSDFDSDFVYKSFYVLAEVVISTRS